ncbi:MAG: low molecular weight phosphotyrosine protein phosphatase [Rickettsiales bacterium]|nr:low molecular weight phosphotyrosine protein phosphatase [Rickettsiales bacterium]
MKILFVCTGNICRSPTAHAIARHKAKELKVENQFIFDSAGIEGYHSGESPDQRSVKACKDKGISCDNIFSRKITDKDFENFDLIFAMDKSHLKHLLRISPSNHHHKIKLFLEFCDTKNSWHDEVVDPYYHSYKEFLDVFDIIEIAIEKLFKII